MLYTKVSHACIFENRLTHSLAESRPYLANLSLNDARGLSLILEMNEIEMRDEG